MFKLTQQAQADASASRQRNTPKIDKSALTIGHAKRIDAKSTCASSRGSLASSAAGPLLRPTMFASHNPEA
jgi:hypothetical protein